MKKYQQIKLRIIAHTDCRGDEKYNLELSQKRANHIKEYLVKRAISEDRLIAIGKGESESLKGVNCGCDSDKPCSDNQHFLNRRSEFEIVR